MRDYGRRRIRGRQRHPPGAGPIGSCMRSPEKRPAQALRGLHWHTLDLKQPDEVRRTLAEIAPDVVIHAAAIADIDFCERHPDVARAVNVGLTQAVADSCSQSRARLVYISTDNVFDGERGNYVEADPPSPINEYARTKAESEAIVAAVAGSIIVRIALVMGFGPLGGGNSFLERTIPMLRAGQTIVVPPEELRTPIDVITLGQALLELAAGSLAGTIHLAGSDTLDRVSLTRRIAERFGYSPGLVQPRPPAEITGRAPRPRDVSLSNCQSPRGAHDSHAGLRRRRSTWCSRSLD